MEVTVEQLLASSSTSDWLKRALQSATLRDPVDAANDAALMASVLQSRADEKLARDLARIEKPLYSRDSLPSAETLFELLQRGQPCEVNNHSLSPDEHGVWITNPYGIDSLWQELTIERVENFLEQMAEGKDVGPVP